MQETAPNLSPFGLDPNGLLYFSISLLAGVAVLVVLQWRRFDEPTAPKISRDYVTQFLPRDLASPREYSLGLLVYLAAMLGLMVLLSVLGPPAAKIIGVQSPPAGIFPLFVALAIVGLLPNIPVFKEFEFSIRKLAHRRAFIPDAARATAERLTTANFDFSRYQTPQVLSEDELKCVLVTDFSAPRGTIEYNWARLCSLCYALRVRHQTNAEGLDRRFLQSYDECISALYETRAKLEPKVEQFRKTPGDRELRRALRSKILEALQRLYILIGCSTRLRGGRPRDIDQRLRGFGFDLSPVRDPPTQNDLIIVGLAVMAAGVFVICLIASELVRYQLWKPSPYFPTGPFDPFVWAISAALAHGAAIFTADKVRSRRSIRSVGSTPVPRVRD